MLDSLGRKFCASVRPCVRAPGAELPSSKKKMAELPSPKFPSDGLKCLILIINHYLGTSAAAPSAELPSSKKNGRATFPEISERWVEMSKSLSRDLRRRPNVTEPSQAESQSQAEPGQAEPIAPSSFTQLPQAPPICISGLWPGVAYYS